MQKKDEILPLTSLRFTTALYVFMFHIEMYFHIIKRGGFGIFLSKGASGMSMFFILSGFVLGYRFSAGIHHYKDYAYSRFARIYPAYFLAALVTLPWLFNSVGIFNNVGYLHYEFIILINILMLQAWFPQLFTVWNIGGSWSLSVEMFFYALFPSIINSIKNASNKSLSTALIVLYFCSAIPGISWLLFSNDSNFILFYILPIFRISEFTIGVICGLFYARGFRINNANRATIISLFLFYWYMAKGPFFSFVIIAQNYAVIPLLVFIIYSVASLESGWVYRASTNKVFLYLGRISYSFYSFQALVLMTLITYRGVIVERLPILQNVYIVMVTAFFVLLVFAAISYHFVEVKFRQFLLNRYKDRKTETVNNPLYS